MKTLQTNELEQIYDDLATAIDQVPASKRELFLAKLVMLLANEQDDPKRFGELLDVARQNLIGS
ncbi:MAG: DUF2783 domain-containing protein [Betaproteobacteria bacterium]|jgi:hypothetical protein|nr:DUF2783 domain-containing protein [Betaproteobacteria bacterium]MBK7657495.1 DUF2783 domain-containing protein [Betaproteobacteria bacterium]MBP6644368.1 DUF2783 domain-containing protein [Burkholderiaceae bacterium]